MPVFKDQSKQRYFVKAFRRGSKMIKSAVRIADKTNKIGKL